MVRPPHWLQRSLEVDELVGRRQLKAREFGELLGPFNGIRLAQGNHLTCRYRQHLAVPLARPIVPWRRSALSRDFAAFLPH
jgi:hypothetical protein